MFLTELAQLNPDSTLAALELHNFQININAPGHVVLETFHNHSELPGVIVTNGEEMVAMISRKIFLERMSQAYSLELYLKRPIQVFLNVAKTESFQLYSTCTIVQAAKIALSRPASLVYEPIVVVQENQQLSLLDIQLLLQAQSQILTGLNTLIQQQQQQAQAYLELLETQRAELQSSKDELRESEERYRRLVELSPETVAVLSTGKFDYINPAGAKLLGAGSPEKVLGKSILNFVHPSYREMLQARVLLLQEKGSQVELIEEKFVRLDGQVIDVEVTGIPITYRGKPATQVLLRDITKRKQAEAALLRAKVAEAAKLELEKEITERKQAEEALSSSLATNRALINALPDLMFRISKEGIFVNFKAPTDNNMLFYKNFLGKNMYEVLPKEVAQLTMHCVEQALQLGEIQIFEYQLLLNNKLHDYEARIVVSAEDEVMAIVRDITPRKQAEADIRNALAKEKELSELKSRFVSMTSHEFRTPLTTILSSAELLQGYGHKFTDEKKRQHLQRVVKAVKHMTQLLNDVLLIGKAEAGKLEFNPTPLDVTQFCRQLVEEMQLSTDTHTIAFYSQSECTNAYIDEKLLRHILSNLFSNAIKYSPQGGIIHFYLVCGQGEVIFRVQDEGIGIPKADQNQLFGSFHRASNVGTISGTGLGLAIVKKSVDLHGGKITVESEVGVGTTFIVTLPDICLENVT